MLLVLYFRCLWQTQVHKDVLLCYLVEALQFYGLHLGLCCDPLCFLFWVYNRKCRSGFVFFVCFAYQHPVILVHLLTSYSLLNCLCTFAENQLPINVWFYFWALFCAIDLFVYLFINTTILIMDLHTECCNRLDWFLPLHSFSK